MCEDFILATERTIKASQISAIFHGFAFVNGDNISPFFFSFFFGKASLRSWGERSYFNALCYYSRLLIQENVSGYTGLEAPTLG